MNVTFALPGAIVGETGLSSWGIGVSESLLSRANDAPTIQSYPWRLIPGVFITVAVLAFDFLGDTLCDAFDPFKSSEPGQEVGVAPAQGA